MTDNSAPLMPKATAVWLIDNTSLTFDQIARFCKLHPMEVQALADAEQNKMVGFDPITSGQLTHEEIKRCEDDASADLHLNESLAKRYIESKKATKYIPLAKRRDRPNAIAWLIKFYPHLKDSTICKLVNTTKATVAAVRSKSHWNSENISAQSPVTLGLCSQEELDKAIK